MMTSFLLAGTFGSQLDAWFSGFDFSIFQFFGSFQNDILTLIAKAFTAMGSTMYIAMFAALGLILCFFRRTRKVGFAIVFAVIVGTLFTNILIKPWVLRIRPYNTLQGNAAYWNWYVGAGMLSESDYCFPSGHTTGATEIAIALMLCHASSRRKSAKAFAWVFPVVALLVGASRVYLMVHYATDILAGFIIGIIAGVIGYFLSKAVCRIFRKDRTPEAQANMKKGLRGGVVFMLILVWLCMFGLSFKQIITSGGEDAVRCAYDGDYDCQNEARTDDKYPAIDGEYYCKIHWKELTGN